jgi:hypothetical protein
VLTPPSSQTGHRFQLRFSTLTDTQSFVATLIQHCPPLVASDVASRVSGGGVLKSATINTPSAVGGRLYGMDYGNGMGTTGNWENETQMTIVSVHYESSFHISFGVTSIQLHHLPAFFPAVLRCRWLQSPQTTTHPAASSPS